MLRHWIGPVRVVYGTGRIQYFFNSADQRPTRAGVRSRKYRDETGRCSLVPHSRIRQEFGVVGVVGECLQDRCCQNCECDRFYGASPRNARNKRNPLKVSQVRDLDQRRDGVNVDVSIITPCCLCAHGLVALSPPPDSTRVSSHDFQSTARFFPECFSADRVSGGCMRIFWLRGPRLQVHRFRYREFRVPGTVRFGI